MSSSDSDEDDSGSMFGFGRGSGSIAMSKKMTKNEDVEWVTPKTAPNKASSLANEIPIPKPLQAKKKSLTPPQSADVVATQTTKLQQAVLTEPPKSVPVAASTPSPALDLAVTSSQATQTSPIKPVAPVVTAQEAQIQQQQVPQQVFLQQQQQPALVSMPVQQQPVQMQQPAPPPLVFNPTTGQWQIVGQQHPHIVHQQPLQSTQPQPVYQQQQPILTPQPQTVYQQYQAPTYVAPAPVVPVQAVQVVQQQVAPVVQQQAAPVVQQQAAPVMQQQGATANPQLVQTAATPQSATSPSHYTNREDSIYGGHGDSRVLSQRLSNENIDVADDEPERDPFIWGGGGGSSLSLSGVSIGSKGSREAREAAEEAGKAYELAERERKIAEFEKQLGK